MTGLPFPATHPLDRRPVRQAEARAVEAGKVLLPGRIVKRTPYGCEVAFGEPSPDCPARGRPVWVPACLCQDLGATDVIAGAHHVFVLPASFVTEKGLDR